MKIEVLDLVDVDKHLKFDKKLIKLFILIAILLIISISFISNCHFFCNVFSLLQTLLSFFLYALEPKFLALQVLQIYLKTFKTSIKLFIE